MAATVQLSPLPKQRFVDTTTGLALVGGKVFTYASGTTTKQATYTDSTGTTQNPNPVVLDARGEAAIWLDQSLSYKIVLAPSTDTDPPTNPIWTQDGIPSSGLISFLVTLATSAGATLVGWVQAGAAAVLRTIQAKLREVQVSSMDYGTVGNGSTTDDTLALQALLTYTQTTYDPATYASQSPANGRSTSFIPAGYYKATSALTLTKKVALVGDGPAEFSSGTRLVQYTSNTDLITMTPIAQGSSLSVENMALISNTSGTGALIHIVASGGGCNSQRYDNLVFGTPQTAAMNIEYGDDIMVRSCLIDVSATSGYALGTSTAANVVSNVQFISCKWFQVAIRGFLLFNVSGLQVIGASVYPSSGTNYMQYFMDGTNTTPYQINGVEIIGGDFHNVQTLIYATNPNNLKISGITAIGCKPTIVGFIAPVTTATNLTITGNTISGDFSTKKVYDDAGATVTGANITGNTFVNTGGGTVAALNVAATTGRIANNTFVGFNLPCVSQRWVTSGSAIAPGTIAAGSSFTFTLAIAGAIVGDTVTSWSPAATDPIPNGLTTRAWISAAGTLSFKLTNNTAGGIVVSAFDYAFLVER